MPTTDPLIEAIAAELRRTVEGGETVTDAAERLYAAVQASGRLLGPGAVIVATTETAPGFEIAEEWGIRSSAGVLSGWGKRADAEVIMRGRTRAGRPPGELVCRSVYTGPWEVAP